MEKNKTNNAVTPTTATAETVNGSKAYLIEQSKRKADGKKFVVIPKSNFVANNDLYLDTLDSIVNAMNGKKADAKTDKAVNHLIDIALAILNIEGGTITVKDLISRKALANKRIHTGNDAETLDSLQVIKKSLDSLESDTYTFEDYQTAICKMLESESITENGKTLALNCLLESGTMAQIDDNNLSFTSAFYDALKGIIVNLTNNGKVFDTMLYYNVSRNAFRSNFETALADKLNGNRNNDGTTTLSRLADKKAQASYTEWLNKFDAFGIDYALLEKADNTTDFNKIFKDLKKAYYKAVESKAVETVLETAKTETETAETVK